MANLLAEDEFAEAEGEEDTDGREYKIQNVGMLKFDAKQQGTDAVGRRFDENGRQTA